MRVKSLLLFAFCILYFSLSGQTGKQTIHVPGDQPTIQEGINAAQDGDVVLVDEGLYYENINFNGKAITVASLFWQDGDSSHIENTIIDGQLSSNPDSASVVSFLNGEDTTSVICGFTIQGGSGTMIYGCLLGGGILCDHSGPSILNNHIIYNAVVNSGEFVAGAGIQCIYSDHVIIRDNRIKYNNAYSEQISTIGVSGGGIAIWYCGEATIEDNIITGNSVYATPAGG